MDSWSVISTVLPWVQQELGDVDVLDVSASLLSLQRWQTKHRRSQVLPGIPSMPNQRLDTALIDTSFRMCRIATACYGWKGQWFFYLTDPNASYGLDSFRPLLRSAVAGGDNDAFVQLAGISRDELLFASPAALVGVPKHFVMVDAHSRSIVLAIRGTMSLNDGLTDAMSREEPFCGGVAHEGIAHAARTIFAGTRELIEAELAKRPGWGLTVTGHSLGAATAMLYTILAHHERRVARGFVPTASSAVALGSSLLHLERNDEASASSSASSRSHLQSHTAPSPRSVPFDSADVECYAFAPPPVFAPLSSLPEETQHSITSWIHNEDIIPRLTLQSLRDVIRICRKVSAAHPSMASRVFGEVELSHVLDSEPQWLRSWTGKEAATLMAAARRQQAGMPAPSSAPGAEASVDPLAQHGPPPIAGLGASDARSATPLTPAKTPASQAGSRSAPASSDEHTALRVNTEAVSVAESATRDEIPRFQIPGTIFCFRAPVDIGAAFGLRDRARGADPSAPIDASAGQDAGSKSSVTNAANSIFKSLADPTTWPWPSDLKTRSSGGTSSGAGARGSLLGSVTSSSSSAPSPLHAVATGLAGAWDSVTNAVASAATAVGSAASNVVSTAAKVMVVSPTEEPSASNSNMRSGDGASREDNGSPYGHDVGLSGGFDQQSLQQHSPLRIPGDENHGSGHPPYASLERSSKPQSSSAGAALAGSADFALLPPSPTSDSSSSGGGSNTGASSGSAGYASDWWPQRSLQAKLDQLHQPRQQSSGSTDPAHTQIDSASEPFHAVSHSAAAARTRAVSADIESATLSSQLSPFQRLSPLRPERVPPVRHQPHDEPASNVDDVQLAPGVGAEAAERAEVEELPYVTVCGPDDLRNLPLTDKAWRDHVPDQYLFGLRQLKEVADRQAADRCAREHGRDTAALLWPGVRLSASDNLASMQHTAAAQRPQPRDTRHLRIGDNVVQISKADERTGGAKEPYPHAPATATGKPYIANGGS